MHLRLSSASWLFLLASLFLVAHAHAREIRSYRSVSAPHPQTDQVIQHVPIPWGEVLVSVEVLPRGLDPRLPRTWPIENQTLGTLRGQQIVGLVLPTRLDRGAEPVFLEAYEVVVQTRPGFPSDLRYQRQSPESRRSFDHAWKELTGTERDHAQQPRVSRVNSGEPHHPTFRPSVNGDPVDMVIITDSTQVGEYQRLADFKTQTGILTVVRTVDWIDSHYQEGVDRQESIRNFIREAATLWGTAWILLGGDTDVIPVRLGHTLYFGSEDIPTDLYYAALDGTWNADGNDIFGEAPQDSCDLYPDVWVGRMPSRNAADAQILVDKTLAYQKTPTPGYQTDYLLFGEVLSPETWNPGDPIFFDGAVYCDTLYNSRPPGTQAVRMYENYTAWPGTLQLDKPDALDSLNAGFGLVHHVGHGYINTMSLGFEEKSLNNSDADALTNGDQTFVLYAINCTSSAIDFNCLAERFMLNPNGGAVSSVGSTRWDFPFTGAFYQDVFYDLLFNQNTPEVGMAMALSKMAFVPSATYDGEHRWTQFTQIYLGDPSLRFWLAEPDTLAVSHSGTYTLRDYSYAVDVSFKGSAAESALVTAYKDGDEFATGWTNSSGHVSLNFSPDEVGTFTVGVTYPDAVPFLDSAQVVAGVGAPYLYAASQTLDDDNAGSSWGNGDGRADAGETIEWNLSLRNSGSAGDANITAQITTTDPYLTINDNGSSFADIAAGLTQAPSDPFVVTIAPDTPDKYEAKLSLFVFSDNGPYIQDVILYVHAPIYEYRQQAVRDTIGSGNGDGVITANEDFVILPTIRNLGLGLATNMEVRLRSTDPDVTINDSVAVVGTLGTEGIFTTSGDGLELSLADVSGYHQLQIVLVDDRGEVGSHLVDWTPPAAINDSTALAVGTANSISLSWDPVVEPDLWGYNVYRASAEVGPYARVNQNTTDNHATFTDENLPGLTRYYYKIASIDTSGNESGFSGAISGTTTLPLSAGWPVDYATATTGGITLADLNGDASLEIIAGADELFVLNADGTEFLNGDGDVRTLGPFSSTGGAEFWNTPAVSDIDLDGTVDLAAVSWDAQLWVWDSAGNVRSGFPKDVNPLGHANPAPLGSVSFGDVDADGKEEILVTVGEILFMWHEDGTEVVDGDSNGSTDGVFAVTGTKFSYGTPTVANIDSDPFKEIIAGMRDGKLYVFNADGSNYPGFPFDTGNVITTSPVVADIDGDGAMEILFGSASQFLYALRADLTQPGSWPVAIQMMQDQAPAPGLGDLTGDGMPDVVIGASNGSLWAFDGPTGNTLANFPIPITDALGGQVEIRSSAVVVDLDNDGSLDIIVGDQLGRLHGFDASGSVLPGFPIWTGNLIQSAPAVWDVDGDGLNEVLAQSFDQRIYCWDTPWSANAAKSSWPMFKGDQRNRGVWGADTFSVIGVDDEPVLPILTRAFPNPSRQRITIQYQIPQGKEFEQVSLSIYDIQGRLVRELQSGEQPPGLFSIDWDLLDQSHRTVASGIYPYRLQIGNRVTHRKLVVLP